MMDICDVMSICSTTTPMTLEGGGYDTLSFAPLFLDSIPVGLLLDAVPVFLLKELNLLKLVGLLEAPWLLDFGFGIGMGSGMGSLTLPCRSWMQSESLPQSLDSRHDLW